MTKLYVNAEITLFDGTLDRKRADKNDILVERET